MNTENLPMIEVSIAKQSMTLTDEYGFIHSYPISSAANGIGYDEGSFCTPLGNFVISEKHGSGAEPMTIFVGREPVGIYDPALPSEKDHVLTRILWLDGLDGENSNTKARYIYIHGTNQEGRIGSPASCGCIRMINDDIIDFYDRVPEGTRVVIKL